MTNQILLKDTLPSGQIVYIINHNDEKKYTFLFNTEPTQSVIDNEVAKQLDLEALAAQHEKDKESSDAVVKENTGG